MDLGADERNGDCGFDQADFLLGILIFEGDGDSKDSMSEILTPKVAVEVDSSSTSLLSESLRQIGLLIRLLDLINAYSKLILTTFKNYLVERLNKFCRKFR